MTHPRVLIMGCGGIGGVVAATLFEHGVEPVVVTHNEAIADAVNDRGILVHEDGARHMVAARATALLPANAGPFDVVLLATQPPDVEQAAGTARHHLAPDGVMVCLQNGLCEQRVAAIAGPTRTLGAIVAWGGSMLEPGIYERTSGGGFVIGRLDGTDDPRFAAVRALLQPVGPVEVTHNLRGARWSKLAINCAISSLGTIGGERLGVLLRYRFVRRLALEVMTEAVAVARARGVRLEKVAGTIDLDWVVLSDSERAVSASPTLVAKHALLLAVGAKFRRLLSSMLVAIERGRQPAVDYLNGEVVWRAQQLGIAVPLNQRLPQIIHAIARGAVRPGLPLLRQLYAESRSDVHAGPPRLSAGGADAAVPPAV